MTHYLLIRHAMCDEVGEKFTGRMPEIHLNAEGKKQAGYLARRLGKVPLAAVVSSPLERAIETAAPIAASRGLRVEPREGLQEIHPGEWTGFSFADLSGQHRWRSFNTFRSCIRPPGGEMMIEAQSRIVTELELLRNSYPDRMIAVISHADVIKAALAHYAGVHLDLFHRIEISPSSISIVAIDDNGPGILCVNDTGRMLF